MGKRTTLLVLESADMHDLYAKLYDGPLTDISQMLDWSEYTRVSTRTVIAAAMSQKLRKLDVPPVAMIIFPREEDESVKDWNRRFGCHGLGSILSTGFKELILVDRETHQNSVKLAEHLATVKV